MCLRIFFLLVRVITRGSYSLVVAVIFQCFPGLWSEGCDSRSVVAEMFGATLGYMPEYIKDVGHSVALVFFTQQQKKCTATW